MVKNKVIGFLFLLFLPHIVSASELTLEQTVEQAWTELPLLKSQLHSQAALYQISSSDRWRRFLPNEPQILYSNNDTGSSEVFSVFETVSFPGKAFALSSLDKAREHAQLMELRAKKYEIARTVIETYLNAAVSNELVEQQKRNITDTETVANSLKARYESGLATQAETIVTELQLRQQKADLLMLEDKAKSAFARLKTLLHIQDDSPMSLVLSDDLDDRLLSEIGDRTADEMRADAAKDLAEASRTTAIWAQMPDLSFGISKNHYLFLPASPSGKEVTRSYSIGMTLPFFFPVSERIEKNRQREQAAMDKANAELQELTAREDREESLLEYKRSKTRLAELREKDLPFAEALIESTFSAYKSGKLGMAELILARKTLMDLRAQDVQLRGQIISAHLRSLNTEGV